jgi:hypothetical protein
MAASNLLLFGGLVFLGLKVAAAVRDITASAREAVQPTLDSVNALASQTSDVLNDVGGSLGRVARESEATVQDVSRKVRTTTGLVSAAVSRPSTTMESVMYGLGVGVATLLGSRGKRD